MSKGPMSCWVSIQMSPHEKEVLDAAVERAKREDPLMTRNKFLRRFIATLEGQVTHQ